MTGESRDRATDRAYRDHAGEVYRVAYAILRDRDEALDATHDAFARAWERWAQDDGKRPLQPWLHGIVVHVALDQLRRRRVRRLAVSLLGSAAVTDIGTGAGADPSVDVVRRHVVEDGLASLRPDARAALVLRHYYGYAYAEIATYLGTTSGTVGSMLSRAHAALRLRLEAEPAAKAGPPAVTPSAATTSSVERTTEPPEVFP